MRDALRFCFLLPLWLVSALLLLPLFFCCAGAVFSSFAFSLRFRRFVCFLSSLGAGFLWYCVRVLNGQVTISDHSCMGSPWQLRIILPYHADRTPAVPALHRRGVEVMGAGPSRYKSMELFQGRMVLVEQHHARDSPLYSTNADSRQRMRLQL